MKPLRIDGWEVGFNKVEFTKLLQRELGYSLSHAKSITDRVSEGERVEILVPERVHDHLSRRASEIGAILAAEAPTGKEAEKTCQ